MIDENIFSELHAVSKVADKRSEDAHVIQRAAKKFFQIRNMAFVIWHLCICFCAEFSRPHTRFARLHERKLYKSSLTRLAHHLVHGLRLANICRAAFVHQAVDISFFVFHFLTPPFTFRFFQASHPPPFQPLTFPSGQSHPARQGQILPPHFCRAA